MWASLAGARPTGRAQLAVLKKKPGEAFAGPGMVDGDLDMTTVADAWAGDVSGDGRADLIVREHPKTGGVALQHGHHQEPSALRQRSSATRCGLPGRLRRTRPG